MTASTALGLGRVTLTLVVLVVLVAGLALLVAVTTEPSTGSAPLSRLARVRVRAVRLLLAAAVVQVGTAALAPGWAPARAFALVLTAVLVGLFLVGNARLPGVPLMALGLLLNLAVISANGAMPVSVPAAAAAGLSRDDLRLHRDAMRERVSTDTRLRLLADVVPVALPRWPQVVSAGDVLVASGVGLLLLTAGGRRRQRPRRVPRSTVWDRDSTTIGSYAP